jgi:sugar lactone lactonase YvrE
MWRNARRTASGPDRTTVGAASAIALALSLALSLALTACSSNSTAPPSGSVVLWVANSGLTKTGHSVNGANANSILGYTAAQIATATTAAPAVKLVTNSGNGGIVLDATGNLWVTDPSNNAVSEYTAAQLKKNGQPAPAVVIASDANGSLDSPEALAMDGNGNLWVANSAPDGSGANTVVEFTKSQLSASGSPQPAVRLAPNAGSINNPQGIAFDPLGNLWVSDSGAVKEFSVSQLAASGAPVPAVTIGDDGLGSLNGPEGITFDAKGNLWVTVFFSNLIAGYSSNQLATSGNPVPAVIVRAGDQSALNNPCGLAFDATGDLWVSNFTTSWLLKFVAKQLASPSSPKPVVFVASGALVSPCALAFVR